MGQTITIAEYGQALKDYEKAYEDGLTVQECSFCGELVVEKVANWDYWRGSGVILHQHCEVHWMQGRVARDWWRLGFGVIADNWYIGPVTGPEDSEEYMKTFMSALGYGRWS